MNDCVKKQPSDGSHAQRPKQPTASTGAKARESSRAQESTSQILVGYASKTLAVPGAAMRSITKRLATSERLAQVVSDNLAALETTLDYNRANEIRLFRISSDVIPFGSNPVNQLDWQTAFASQLAHLGEKARAYGIRLSMHPGQYTVLNSPDPDVAQRAAADLSYHDAFLTALGMDGTCKIILHVGGAYGDKRAALDRFASAYQKLPSTIRQRLVIENDDRLFTALDVLQLCRRIGAPMVFDTLHHQINHEPAAPDQLTLIDKARSTWTASDGRQKIHYSQQALGKRAGAHTDTIAIDEFLEFRTALGDRCPDVMLEVKDKNLSAVKCLTCLDRNGPITRLEQEWARYKYVVLEHDQASYQRIRTLLKDKQSRPAVPFYRLVEQSLAIPASTGSFANAAQHVWGYVSDLSTDKERASFLDAMERFQRGEATAESVKRKLLGLARKYDQAYLLASYYFAL